jgi:TonB family protein
MNYSLLKFTLILSITLLASYSLTAQIKKTQLNQLTIELQEQEKEVAKCQQKGIRISHFCYEFCPTNLVKPSYSKEAKKLGISGQVKIEVIVNESGRVIYARSIENKLFLAQAARKAALRSTFQPKRNCDNKPIKFRGTIIYNFY